MKKIYFLITIVLSIFATAQKFKTIKILDADDQKPIANARIILPNQVFFTNDDGLVAIPENSVDLNVSSSNYETLDNVKLTSIISLKPLFKDIDEVAMQRVDIKKILKNILKNYDKAYFTEPTLYEISFKSKGYNNGLLYVATIADAKWWTKNNKYNWKLGFNEKYDEILQINFESVKRLNIIKSDSIFKGYTGEFSHQNIGRYFFNFELERFKSYVNAKNAKVSAFIISEKDDLKTIKVSVKIPGRSNLVADIIYDEKNNAISYFEVNYHQDELPIMNRKTTDGRDFENKLGDVKIIHSFYLKNGNYIPAFYSESGDHFIIIEKGKKYDRKFSTQITYNTFMPSEKDLVLENRVNIKDNWFRNAPEISKKDNTMSVLSKEEQEFLNQIKDEE